MPPTTQHSVGILGLLGSLMLIFGSHLITGTAVGPQDYALAATTIATYFGIPLGAQAVSNSTASSSSSTKAP